MHTFLLPIIHNHHQFVQSNLYCCCISILSLTSCNGSHSGTSPFHSQQRFLNTRAIIASPFYTSDTTECDNPRRSGITNQALSLYMPTHARPVSTHGDSMVDTAIFSSLHVYQGARKPPNGTLKSGPQTTMKGHPKTPGAEGKELESQMLNFFNCSSILICECIQD